MGLNSIDNLLRHLQRQPGWEGLRRYQAVQAAWQQIINPALLSQTQPLGIQQQTLTIAVNSPALAQNLQLQRVTLLKRLNAQLSKAGEAELTDLRFSPLHWHRRRSPTPVVPLNEMAARPLPEVPPSPHTDPPRTAHEALTRWLHTLERRSSVLATCPQCQSPALPEPLERWGCCQACARQQWQ